MQARLCFWNLPYTLTWIGPIQIDGYKLVMASPQDIYNSSWCMNVGHFSLKVLLLQLRGKGSNFEAATKEQPSGATWSWKIHLDLCQERRLRKECLKINGSSEKPFREIQPVVEKQSLAFRENWPPQKLQPRQEVVLQAFLPCQQESSARTFATSAKCSIGVSTTSANGKNFCHVSKSGKENYSQELLPHD